MNAAITKAELKRFIRARYQGARLQKATGTYFCRGHEYREEEMLGEAAAEKELWIEGIAEKPEWISSGR